MISEKRPNNKCFAARNNRINAIGPEDNDIGLHRGRSLCTVYLAMHFSAWFTRKIDAAKRDRLEKFVPHSYIRGNAREQISPISRLFPSFLSLVAREKIQRLWIHSIFNTASYQALSTTGYRGAAFPLYAANGVTACGINVTAESTMSIKSVNLVAFSAP